MVERLRGMREFRLLCFLLLIALVVTILEPKFLTVDNIMDILSASAIVLIVASGVTVVVIAGGIDISVGAVLAAAGIACGTLLQNGDGSVLAIALGIGVGLGFGLINALLIVLLDISAIVVTLAMLIIVKALLASRQSSTTVTNFKGWFADLAQQHVGPVPAIVIIAFSIATALALFMGYTRTGRSLYALGGNPEGATLAGVNGRRLRLFAYVLSGGLAGVAGCLFASQYGAVDTTTGDGYEFLAIAALVLGGTDLFGGEGRIAGTILGCVVIYTIYNGMVLAKIPGTWQEAVVGATIVLAVVIDGWKRRESRDAVTNLSENTQSEEIPDGVG
jgi:ribose/xylose/arabinose/galactoside ABC-type transport system permease subunit